MKKFDTTDTTDGSLSKKLNVDKCEQHEQDDIQNNTHDEKMKDIGSDDKIDKINKKKLEVEDGDDIVDGVVDDVEQKN